MSREDGYSGSSCWWKCTDCGSLFLKLNAALVPRALEEQAEMPLCVRCWQRRFDRALMELSGQANPRHD
jgi:hypothetical protein